MTTKAKKFLLLAVTFMIAAGGVTLCYCMQDYLRAYAWHIRNGDAIAIGNSKLPILPRWWSSRRSNDLISLEKADGADRTNPPEILIRKEAEEEKRRTNIDIEDTYKNELKKNERFRSGRQDDLSRVATGHSNFICLQQQAAIADFVSVECRSSQNDFVFSYAGPLYAKAEFVKMLESMK